MDTFDGGCMMRGGSGARRGQLETIKILIADDHAVVREGTRKILEHEPDFDVVAEASDGEEAVRLTGTFHPDVAIIDIAMPGVNNIRQFCDPG